MLRFFSLFLLLLFVADARAQETRFLDLTERAPRTRSRQPVSATFSSAAVAAVADGSGHPTRETALQITLVSIDGTMHRIGDKLVCEVRLRNNGNETLYIPWTPDLGDLEPKELEPYEYSSLAISLWFRTATDQMASSFPVVLYGMPSKKMSVLKLGPGESAKVRFGVPFNSPDASFRASASSTRGNPIAVRASAELSRSRVIVRNGAYHEEATSDGRPSMSAEVKAIQAALADQ